MTRNPSKALTTIVYKGEPGFLTSATSA